MTPEQEHTFVQAMSLGIACGLTHRFECYVNASRALMHGPYVDISDNQQKLNEAFLAFEKTTASCGEEQDELNKLTVEGYVKVVNDWYARHT